MGGGGEKEACHNEVKLLPMQELEAARTLLSTMNASHFHTPPAGSQLCGTFGFKCTTTVISATSETEHPSFSFSASPHPTCLSQSCIGYPHILGATEQGTKNAFLTKSFAARVHMAGVGKQRC